MVSSGRAAAWCFTTVGREVLRRWGSVHALDPVGRMRFRNAIFRNISGTLSSELIIAAVAVTYAEWLRKYGALPAEPLRTEIDVEATAARRSKHSEPGRCYLCAGWRWIRDIPAGHGRSSKVELEAPSMLELEAWERAAGDAELTLAEWIRERCNRSIARSA